MEEKGNVSSFIKKQEEKEMEKQVMADRLYEEMVNTISEVQKSFEDLEKYSEEIEKKVGKKGMKRILETIGNAGKGNIRSGNKLIIQQVERLEKALSTNQLRKI